MSSVILVSSVLLFGVGAVFVAPLLSRADARGRSMAWLGAATMVAAIPFSPGTLTLELSDGPPYRMVVHALGQNAVEVNSEVAELEDSAQGMYR